MPEQVLIPHQRPRDAWVVVSALLSNFKDGEVKSWLRLAQKEIYLVSLQKQNKEGYCIFFPFAAFLGKRRMKGKF